VSIPTILRQQALDRGSAPAIIESPGGKEYRISFAELDRLATSFGSYLYRRRVRKGDNVLVFVPMSASLYPILLGIFESGATAVFMDPSAGLAHLNVCSSLCRPKAFIGSAKAHLLRLVCSEMRGIPIAIHTKQALQTEDLAPDELPEPDLTDPALMTFTSGSTGQPKAAVRTHGFLLAQHRALADSIKLEPGELDLTTLPIFVLANLASGVTSLLPDANISRPGTVKVEGIAAQIDRYHPTRTGGSPAFYTQLAEFSETRRNILSGFQKIYTGGAPVFPALLRRLQSLARDAEVTAVYGSTEAEPIAHVSYQEIRSSSDQRAGSNGGLLAGKPIAGIKCAVIADRWGKPLGPMTQNEFVRTQCPANQTGEIVVQGPHVLSGYLNGVGDQETKFKVDDLIWHRTGDAGYFDDQSRLWLLGRCAAKVYDQRGPVYPFAVECIIQNLEFVRRCAFLDHQGARLLLIEPIGTNLSEQERAQLSAAVNPFAVDEIRVMKLPVDRRHNAKIDYPRLRKMLA
jgi:acyl-CoA synthetase (AMP-forming)/AMP-acid ligase II